MKRLLTLLLLIISLTVQAQDLKSYFIAMPDTLSPLLTKVNRQDFGDFLASNMKAVVKNRLGNESEMTKLTDDYLQLKLTSVSEMEMKLLPVNDSTQVICVAKTYNGPVPDTNVDFYTTEWKKLDASDYITFPAKEEFYQIPLSTEVSDSITQAIHRADIYLIKANLSDKEQVLTVKYTTPQYLDEETAKLLKKYLRQSPIQYLWKDGKFIRK